MRETNKTTTIENKNKMQELMSMLHICKGNIVSVSGNVYICNEKYDLVSLENKYSVTVPNLILGMVSGKYNYTVYSVSSVLHFDAQSKEC